MQHVAIDLGGVKSQICVRSEGGEILLERKVETLRLDAMLKRQPSSRVVLETCAEAFRIADLALASGHEVRVVPATLVKSLGVGARRIKTDRRDAQVLSEVSCRIDLPSVHVPLEIARVRRNMCASREVLVSCRTAMINSVRGWARTQLLKIPSGGAEAFPARARKAALASHDGLPEYAWNFRRLRPHDPIAKWALQIEQRRGKFIATVATARKLAGVLFAIWRDGSTYMPSHSAPSNLE